MGINTFTFDGVSSDTYGVYITEGASYNAPERAVEMLEIPGRNGHFALDQGRFENVEVTYRAFIDGSSIADYAANLSDLRNWLCSKVGYVRLSDTYNPNEYRMAIYKSGLEVDGTSVQSGEFNIVFDCKPQRWLTSGETATSVADGGTLTNPTPFDASPLLEVTGYGDIDIGGQSIGVENKLIGDIVIYDGNNYESTPKAITLDTRMLNNGDDIVFPSDFEVYYWGYSIASLGVTTETNCTTRVEGTFQQFYRALFITPTDTAFVYGTAKTVTCSAEYTVLYGTYPYTSTNVTATCTVVYDGSESVTANISLSTDIPSITTRTYEKTSEVIADSTKSALGNPMYIDLDIGEAWNEDYGTPVSVNDAVSFGATLPVLPSQSTTTINYDNTITDLKIAPRWWRV